MKKKIVGLLLTMAMAVSLTACGGGNSSEGPEGTDEQENGNGDTSGAEGGENVGDASGDGTHIYILTASEDHGWTGSVATFAKEKAQEVNDGGKYTAEVITASDANDQINKLEDIVASGKDDIALVIQPMDDTVQSAIQAAIDEGIPYCAFDRIIDTVAPTAVSNVKGDNAGIGAGAAAYFVELGLKPGEEVYVYEGDTSSVTTLRDEGFEKYLTGEMEFGGSTISDDAKWSEDDLKAITYSGAMNWSRSDTKTNFESLLGEASNADMKWFYAEDDELAMGILEALNGGGISDSTKEAFLANKPVITGCGGLNEFYEVLRGNLYEDIAGQCGGVMSVTYSPSMIQTAIQDMVDHLDGKDVEQDHVIECENVTSENVDDFEAFN